MKKPRKFTIQTIEVHGNGVRGLSLPDVAVMGSKFGPAMTELFAMATAQKDASSDTLGAVVKRAASDFPEVIGTIIVLATDGDVDDVADADKLPMGIQIEYLEAIFNATFRSESDIVKMIASLSEMLKKVSTAIESSPDLDLQNGTGI